MKLPYGAVNGNLVMLPEILLVEVSKSPTNVRLPVILPPLGGVKRTVISKESPALIV